MSPKSFTALLYDSFQRTYGPAATVIGSVVTIAAFLLAPDDWDLDGRWVVLGGIVSLYLHWLLLNAAVYAFRGIKPSLPVVKHGRAAPEFNQNAVAMLVLEPSDLYPRGSMVSIYRDEHFEELFGLGSVFNVQENGMIQVMVNESVVSPDRWSGVIGNRAEELGRLKVKPTVPMISLGQTEYQLIPPPPSEENDA